MLTINQRHFLCSRPLSEELHFELANNYICQLSNHAVLEVVGDKAAAFLQGQLTCDVNQVSPDTMRQGALCNLKGRILAIMDVVLWEKRLFLILPQDLLEATRLTLSKTAMFSQVSIIPQPSIHIYGLFIQQQQSNAPLLKMQPNAIQGVCSTNEHCCYRLTESLSVLLTTESETILPSPSTPSSSAEFIYRSSLAWHALTLQAGMPSIYPNSRGLFLPHHLELHQTNLISFEKGCYKGQEIIARMQYRAKLKHRIQRVRIETLESFCAGQKIFEVNTQHEIGEVIDFCPYPDNQYLLLISISKPEITTVQFEHHQKPSTFSVAFS